MEPTETLTVVPTNELAQLIKVAVKDALDIALASHFPSKPNTDLDEAISFDSARIRLKLSAPTLRKLIRSGKLHAVTAGRRWLIPSGEITRFLNGGSDASH